VPPKQSVHHHPTISNSCFLKCQDGILDRFAFSISSCGTGTLFDRSSTLIYRTRTNSPYHTLSRSTTLAATNRNVRAGSTFHSRLYPANSATSSSLQYLIANPRALLVHYITLSTATFLFSGSGAYRYVSSHPRSLYTIFRARARRSYSLSLPLEGGKPG
jgi:hypothetical protein